MDAYSPNVSYRNSQHNPLTETEEVPPAAAAQQNNPAVQDNAPTSPSVLHHASKSRAWSIAKDIAIAIPIFIAIGVISHFMPPIVFTVIGFMLFSHYLAMAAGILFSAAKERLNPGFAWF